HSCDDESGSFRHYGALCNGVLHRWLDECRADDNVRACGACLPHRNSWQRRRDSRGHWTYWTCPYRSDWTTDHARRHGSVFRIAGGMHGHRVVSDGAGPTAYRKEQGSSGRSLSDVRPHRSYVDRIKRLARGHEQAIATRTTETDIRAILGQANHSDALTAGRDDLDAGSGAGPDVAIRVAAYPVCSSRSAGTGDIQL